MFESEKIKILVVDDSAIVRDILASIIEKQEDMILVGTAPDPFIARDKIVRLNPDIITLDIEMPRMDGLTFLEKLMQYYPMPAIIVSSITTNDKYAAIKALELGAYDVVNKPGGSLSVDQVADEILLKIRNAYFNRNTFLKKWKELSPKFVKERKTLHKPVLAQVATTEKIIAIGASTGGTVALEYIFERLPQHLPPIVVAQHMPVNFTNQFAQRLNDICQLTVKEAEDEELLQVGTTYIAPGGKHLVVERRGASLFALHDDSDKVNFQKPAADVLFMSVAKVAGKNALGILLTGMGKDGAAGLLEMKNAGAHTIAQDEATSIVWGMPRAAIELGAAVEVLSLDEIIKAIIAFAQT
ncbi:MAG: chemotaxis response regulator protein-glutamate methylesterase [Spirochaetota bacterium]|jgi:two-component system chemotaxis response regulator CheB